MISQALSLTYRGGKQNGRKKNVLRKDNYQFNKVPETSYDSAVLVFSSGDAG